MKKFLLILWLVLVLPIHIFGQNIFRPIKATIYDSQGQFSSINFNCPNMKVYDKGSHVLAYWGGETIKLYRDKNDANFYSDSQTKYGTTIKIAAYRSSNTRKIYLVIVSTISNSQRTDINFKP